jgi:hypothetical protein
MSVAVKALLLLSSNVLPMRQHCLELKKKIGGGRLLQTKHVRLRQVFFVLTAIV